MGGGGESVVGNWSRSGLARMTSGSKKAPGSWTASLRADTVAGSEKEGAASTGKGPVGRLERSEKGLGEESKRGDPRQEEVVAQVGGSGDGACRVVWVEATRGAQWQRWLVERARQVETFGGWAGGAAAGWGMVGWLLDGFAAAVIGEEAKTHIHHWLGRQKASKRSIASPPAPHAPKSRVRPSPGKPPAESRYWVPYGH